MTETRAPELPGPGELRDPVVRKELKRAAVWIGMVIAVLLIWQLAQPLLVVGGAIVFATMLDGGVRLLGKFLPIGRIWRLLITTILVIAFLLWVVWLGSTELADQAAALKDVVISQINNAMKLAQHYGFHVNAAQVTEIGKELFNSAGRLTFAVGSVVGAIASLALIVVLGLFLAIEPRLYERGLAWMLPLEMRDEFYGTMSAMGHTLRRLMAGRLFGMTIEGFGVYILLSLTGVPMAALLGALTGILAFLPNIGAIVSGVLMILVGFSGGMQTGVAAIIVYVIVHIIDGNIIVPMVARRSVDLAPALVLAAQLLLGSLLGILGLALADPIVAMIKVALERGAKHGAEGVEPAAAAAPSTLPTATA
jgi:predicted PurR-regulated permease PerM